jgi:hypothetical protein
MQWLQKRAEEYCSTTNGMGEVVVDFDKVGKLGSGFTSMDALKEVNIEDGDTQRPTYINTNLSDMQKEVCDILREFIDCFAWSYIEMLGLDYGLVEHRLSIKQGFRPYKQPTRSFSPKIIDRVKEEVDKLLQAGFIRSCRYADWVSNIVPVEKKNTCKIRVCVDYQNLNEAMPKNEYPMPIADVLINSASGNKVISFLDGNVGYNQIFMAEEDISKTTFRCLGFVGLFEWVIMTFGLKNTGATYQQAMNLIFHDLLGVMLEVYIDDIVVKSAGFNKHLADLRVLFKRMGKYGLKMNRLKCNFGVSAGKFLGFIVHEKGIQVDPKKVLSLSKLEEPTCKRDMQKLLGKVNYLRRFISNQAGRVETFLPFIRLKHKKEFVWGPEQKVAFERIKAYLANPPVLRASKVGEMFILYITAQPGVIGIVLT